jgi:hypothetical protein
LLIQRIPEIIILNVSPTTQSLPREALQMGLSGDCKGKLGCKKRRVEQKHYPYSRASVNSVGHFKSDLRETDVGKPDLIASQ